MSQPPVQSDSWTTPADVILRWLPVGSEPDTTEEKAKLQALIDDIEDFILSRYPRIQDRIERNELRLSKVVRIVSNAVIRSWKLAKDPRLSFSEAEGPSSISGSFESRMQRTAYLTAEELAELGGGAGRGFVVDLAPRSFRGFYDDDCDDTRARIVSFGGGCE